MEFGIFAIVVIVAAAIIVFALLRDYARAPKVPIAKDHGHDHHGLIWTLLILMLSRDLRTYPTGTAGNSGSTWSAGSTWSIGKTGRVAVTLG